MGFCVASMVHAIVALLPDPVMPNSVWKRSPRVMPSASEAIAVGWSPAGWYGDTTWKRCSSDGTRSAYAALPMLPLRTPHTVIDVMATEHVPALAAYRTLPEVAEFQSWAVPFSDADALAMLGGQHGRTAPERGDWTQLAVTDASGLLGDLAVFLDATGEHAEIGVTLAPHAQGRGVATEALGALVDALLARDVRRIEARTDPANRSSIRLLERLGFEVEAVLHETAVIRGRWVDDVLWTIDATRRSAWMSRPLTRPTSVELVEITPETARTYSHLAVHHSQRSFVSPVAQSYSDALFPEWYEGGVVVPWLRGIVADGEPAGFVMTAEVTDVHPEPYLWRLLIDRRHQGRGIGSSVISQLVERWRAMGLRSMIVGWVDSPDGPEAFYRGLGFEPTGKREHGEIEGRLTF